nr:Hypothetical protein SC2p2_01020 [Methylocystis sp. SC2]
MEPRPLSPLSGRGRKSSRVRRDAAREPSYSPILAQRTSRRSHAMRPDCICASGATTQTLLRNTYFVKQLDRFSLIESHLDAISLEALEYHTRDSLVGQPFPGSNRLGMT